MEKKVTTKDLQVGKTYVYESWADCYKLVVTEIIHRMGVIQINGVLFVKIHPKPWKPSNEKWFGSYGLNDTWYENFSYRNYPKETL